MGLTDMDPVLLEAMCICRALEALGFPRTQQRVELCEEEQEGKKIGVIRVTGRNEGRELSIEHEGWEGGPQALSDAWGPARTVWRSAPESEQDRVWENSITRGNLKYIVQTIRR